MPSTDTTPPVTAPAPAGPPKRAPDAWALDKHGEADPANPGKRRLTLKGAFLLGGCKVHAGWVEGDEVTEQAFEIAMQEFSNTPVGR